MPVRTLEWAVRSSGRDITKVRRPVPTVAKSTVARLKKDELVAMADERGLDIDGTRSDLIARLTGVESNDATVEPADG